MSEVYLPSDLPGLTFQIDRTPEFQTLANVLNGRERRNSNQAQPSYKWRLTWDFIQRPTIPGPTIITGPNELASFIFSRRVDWDYFYYRDPDDCSVTAQVFGAGDGMAKQFQLVKNFSASFPFLETVLAVGGLSSYFLPPGTTTTAPPVIDSAPIFTVAGVTTSVTGVDRNGVVYFPSAPAGGAALAWTGFYYYRCHFINPTATFAEFMHNFWEMRQLEFETVRYST